MPDRTHDLVEALAADTGVSNLLVLSGAARGPASDAIQFDVRPRSANSVFRHLQTLQNDRGGTVAIDYVDATLGEEATPTAEHFLVQRDIPPVWEVVEARIRSDAVYAPSFYILLAIAGLIGAVGILTNSQILIVGAMVVGPEYNAIMGATSLQPHRQSELVLDRRRCPGRDRRRRLADRSASERPYRRVHLGDDHSGGR